MLSTVSETLRSIEKSAERAVVQELRQMTQQILDMRHALVLDDRAHADALLIKLDRLIDDQVIRPTTATESPLLQPELVIDDLLSLSPSGYAVRFFDREFGALEDVTVLENFEQAVQLAVDRMVVRSTDQTEASWVNGRGAVVVRSLHGVALLNIEAIEQPLPPVQTHVARACQALENGETVPVARLFSALRQVA